MSIWIWFALGGLCLILEALSGTFYLLLVALGLFAAGLVAFFDLSLWHQLAGFITVSVLGLLLLNQRRVLRMRANHSATSDVNVNLDIGMLVDVNEWKPHGRTEVMHRGVRWQAALSPQVSAPALPGQYVIVELQGVTLIVEPVNTHNT